MKLAQVTVTIGRNIGENYLVRDYGKDFAQDVLNGEAVWPELGDHDWLAFRGYVRSALANTVGAVTFQYRSKDGSWGGAPEESVLLLVLDANTDPARLALLRGELTKIAFNFRQDAIAFSVGTSELVECEPVPSV